MDEDIPELPPPEGPPGRARKGRGAVSNRSGRFEREVREAVDDGWTLPGEEEPPPLRTTIGIDTARTVITYNKSPDIPFDRSINPYRGCEHGCIYCFARPTHAFYGLSPGLDFESRLFHKPDAPALLRAELARPRYTAEPIALGTNTDPYQPIERELRLTRRIIEVLAEHSHPFSIVTKSHLITRDIDILAPMAAARMAQACISITTLDGDLARRLEPRAPRADRRLATVRALTEAGIPVGVLAAPMIPGLNDMELERILAAARDAGARSAGYVLLRLPLEIKDMFEEWLVQHRPERAARVMSLVRQTRGGRTYDSQWGKRMRGEGAYADLLAQRFLNACRRLGLDKREIALDCSRFRRPAAPGDQLALL